MSQYTPVTNFLSKDSLVSGNPLKAVKGADLTTEFNAVQTAINSKVDGSSVFFADGSAVQPSVGFTNNAGVGMYNVAGALNFATGGVQRVTISSGGATTLNAAAGQTTLTVNGAAANFTAILTGNSTAGSSFGPLISAGTNSSDAALLVTNQGNTLNYIKVFGGGGVVLGNPVGGDPGIGGLNVANSLELGGNPVYSGIPQNLQNANYQFVLADNGRHIYTSTSGLTFTIPANASVAFPIGTAITFINESAGNATLAITTDILSWLKGGSNAAGTRTIATESAVTLLKVSATRWVLTGNGIS